MTALTFLPAEAAALPDWDRIPGLPLPREMVSFVGHEGAQSAFLSAFRSGKLPHAWLLTGPEGVGKASFAYRCARFLLSEAERGAGQPESLAVEGDSPAARLIAHEAHPDLAVLKRRYDPKTKKFRQDISVEDTRDALALFEKTAAFGGWRVLIIDAADDLNAAGANAILKTLEEPPERAIFFLIAHQAQRLLPTIRSRCRALPFAPLDEAAMRALLAGFGEAETQIGAIIPQAQGSIRQALRLRDADLRAFLGAVQAALQDLPRRDIARIDAIAERLRGGPEAAQNLRDLVGAIETWQSAQIRARLTAGASGTMLAPYAESWARLAEEAAKVEAYNLDRRAFVVSTFEALGGLASEGRG